MQNPYQSRVLVLPMVRDGAAGTGGIIVENIDVDKALKLQQPMPVMVVVKDVKLLRRLWHNEYHPDAYYERNAHYYCQNCGELLAVDLVKTKRVNYCPNCGQKLWWNK